jgi:tRNA pseudouridine55 synthase
VEQTLSRFIGEIDQVPPTFSAVKIDGKPAYKSARKGAEVEIKSKKLVIDAIELLSYDLDGKTPKALQPIHIKHADVAQLEAEDDSPTQPTITIRVVCSKGTYIRALARDIGEALGSGAYLTALIRTKVGNYSLQDARDITTFEQWVENSTPTNLNHD